MRTACSIAQYGHRDWINTSGAIWAYIGAIGGPDGRHLLSQAVTRKLALKTVESQNAINGPTKVWSTAFSAYLVGNIGERRYRKCCDKRRDQSTILDFYVHFGLSFDLYFHKI